MDDRRLLIALHEAEGIGWTTIDRLVNWAKPLSKIANWELKNYAEAGISANKATMIRKLLEQLAADRHASAANPKEVFVITRFDQQYPAMLIHTPAPPWVLYCIGKLEVLERPVLAIVGTRTPTAYGRRIAEEWSEQLADRGFTIASGMARGIDSAAHKGALQRIAATVAVMGTAIDVIYPPEHRALYQQIAANGLIVSEYPSGVQSRQGMFPQRNRIIAGLSVGTLVVEAAYGSGSLITARMAVDSSRDVYALPGPVNSANSMGVYEIINEGYAKMVVSVDEIVDNYPWWTTQLQKNEKQAEASLKQAAGYRMSEDEQIIYDLLSDQPVTIDTLQAASKLEFGHLHSVLLSLLIKLQIEQLPGSSYRIRN